SVQRLCGRGEIAIELRLDPLEPSLLFGIGRSVPRRVGTVIGLEPGDTIARKRVSAGKCSFVVLPAGVAELHVLKLLEELQRAFAGNTGCRQVLRAGGVGARFLSTVEAEEVAHGYLLPQRHGAHGGLSAAREGRGDADQGRKQRDLGRFAIAVVEADDVASGNV